MAVGGVWPVVGGALLVASCAYWEARRRLLKWAEKTGSRIGPQWLGERAQSLLRWYSSLVGVRMASEGGALDKMDPSRRYIIVWHPHGFLSWSAVFICSRMAIIGHPFGHEWFATVAPVLFTIPGLCEALMLMNGRSVAKSSMESLLKRGKSIGLQPGGIREQLDTLDDQEQAIFPARLGFIRLALKYGRDLLPVYLFNENGMFTRMRGLDGFTKALYRRTGFGIPFAAGRFGIPMAFFLPRPTDVHVRWGEPIKVGEPDENPSEEKVEELFQRYLVGLQELFAKYASECLEEQIAAKGLKIIRLDGKDVPTVPTVPTLPGGPVS